LHGAIFFAPSPGDFQKAPGEGATA
jgi:hypothetical protein